MKAACVSCIHISNDCGSICTDGKEVHVRIIWCTSQTPIAMAKRETANRTDCEFRCEIHASCKTCARANIHLPDIATKVSLASDHIGNPPGERVDPDPIHAPSIGCDGWILCRDGCQIFNDGEGLPDRRGICNKWLCAKA